MPATRKAGFIILIDEYDEVSFPHINTIQYIIQYIIAVREFLISCKSQPGFLILAIFYY